MEGEANLFTMRITGCSFIPAVLTAAIQMGVLQILARGAAPLFWRDRGSSASRQPIRRRDAWPRPRLPRRLRLPHPPPRRRRRRTGEATDAILKGGVPFERANGMGVFEDMAKDEELKEFFDKGMSHHSFSVMKKIVELYRGFKDLDELMDVGGRVGTSLHMIISKHPCIKGLNFDLSPVIASATAYPGVQHIGVDMFESISPAKNIFMKWILHDWSNELCEKILNYCYKALPASGMVIVVE